MKLTKVESIKGTSVWESDCGSASLVCIKEDTYEVTALRKKRKINVYYAYVDGELVKKTSWSRDTAIKAIKEAL